MEYTEIKIYIPTEDTERASNIATMVVPYGIYIEDYSDLEAAAWEIAHIDLIDEELLEKNREESVIHIYIEEGNNPAEAVSFISERLNSEGISYRIETVGCSEEDWADKWKAFFKPTPVGERLFVRPIWIDEYDAGDRAVLNIEPGAAFGTGTHETTRLCLETLDKIIKDGDTVLDIGCGSGILAIASMLLGAKEGFGVDIDPLAVKTAKENGLMNNFKEPELTFVCGDLADKVTKKYDVVVANIVADIIILFSTQVKAFMKTGAKFIASGIIDTRADEVCLALQNAGLVLKERVEENGWVCLVCE
ncbi:MAG: 50S ribosomal protein L11 methyltransferase [Clostridia bacterium]|nr:50S ribosomal protein L11 methyltransferase [Clostridia bacterium]MBP3560677.1 50S ribosomal protein L11 methyltransferase [Clostridia bacterium]MBQ6838450.1 50S ribosomal protein L11 methyltransferase [Clostridia bacterium]